MSTTPDSSDDPSSVFVSDASPPSEQPEVPDPFQLDDPEDPVSDSDSSEHDETPFGATSQVTIVPADSDVPLQAESDNAHHLLPVREPTAFTPSVNAKPSPPDEAQVEEPEVPRLYIPGLVVPGLFQPIHAVSLDLLAAYGA